MEIVRATAEAEVWSLALPPAAQVLCHAHEPPAVVRALARRGTRVDVVTRCDLDTWLHAAPQLPGRVRGLWEPDASVEYDLALLWDPTTLHDVQTWLASLQALPLPPREVALWTRNRWRGARAPHWFACDRALRGAGWRPARADIALPDADRVRQLVGWDAYTKSPLVRHARTHRPWKERLERSVAGRLLQPARLRLAVLPGIAPRASCFDEIVATAGSMWQRITRIERLLVSPNGVAIGIVESEHGARAVLKTAYRIAAEGRVARNASALIYLADQAARLDAWCGIAPALLAQGHAGAWNFTLEEHVGGTPAQSWAADEAIAALPRAAAFLAALARLGDGPERIAPEYLQRTSGAAVRAACALLAPDHAAQLQRVWEHILAQLDGVAVPLVPRHGDYKLENVLGEPESHTMRVLDWELWTPRGLPLLDAWHLIGSRRARAAGVSLGEGLRRWILPNDLEAHEHALLHSLATDLDPRFVAMTPLLYWLDRLGPIAARGRWPSPMWERTNVLQVLETVQSSVEVHV